MWGSGGEVWKLPLKVWLEIVVKKAENKKQKIIHT